MVRMSYRGGILSLLIAGALALGMAPLQARATSVGERGADGPVERSQDNWPFGSQPPEPGAPGGMVHRASHLGNAPLGIEAVGVETGNPFATGAPVAVLGDTASGNGAPDADGATGDIESLEPAPGAGETEGGTEDAPVLDGDDASDDRDAVMDDPRPDAGPSVVYVAHVARMGWLDEVRDGAQAGTTGRALALEALTVRLEGAEGSVSCQAHVSEVGWQGEAVDGDVSGTTGRALSVEALRLRLTGPVGETCELWYRAHVSRVGWLGWAHGGQVAGSVGFCLPVEAVELLLLPRGSEPPGIVGHASLQAHMVSYHSHVQDLGWQGWAADGAMAGTTGRGLRLEGLAVRLDDGAGTIRYRAHVQDVGWQEWASDEGLAGSVGQARRIEALQMELVGDVASFYEVWYRTHVEGFGWLGWAHDGARAGTEGLCLRLEAVEIRVLPKGSASPGVTTRPFFDQTMVGKVGYQNPPGFYQVSHLSVPVAAGARPPFDFVTPSRIAPNATRDQCVEAFVGRAYDYLGTPYRWDYSCAPGVGVDCVGLVFQCAYACGMNMGTGVGHDDFNPWAHWVSGNAGWHSHDANNLWDYGRAAHVSLAARRRGDVISWPGHVAIYLGGDQMIEATAVSGNVRVASVWAHGVPRGCIRLFQ